MPNFTAQKSVDMSDLSELGLFANFKQLTTPSITFVSSFNATKGNVSMHVTGSSMFAVNKVPTSGTYEGISVTVKGVAQYNLTSLHSPFGSIQSAFSGKFAPNLFSLADTVKGSGQNDKLYGYDAADNIKGAAGLDNIQGGNGADKLNGQGGNDTVNGNAGNDQIDGGPGADKLTGGGGKDSFLFDSTLNGKNIGTITDFIVGADTIQMDHSTFAGIGNPGNSPKFISSSSFAGQKHIVVYDKAHGIISYDENGGTLSDAVEFAKVKAGLNLSAGDFLIT